MAPTPLRVLFLCTGNSCRSQMAEAWAKALKAKELTVASAGVERHGMNPWVAQVMLEAGVDISGQWSKLVSDLDSLQFDYVITLCGHAQETCPRFPGQATLVHQGFDDPASLAKDQPKDQALAQYQRIRDEIKEWVLTLPHSLPPQSHPTSVGFSL